MTPQELLRLEELIDLEIALLVVSREFAPAICTCGKEDPALWSFLQATNNMIHGARLAVKEVSGPIRYEMQHKLNEQQAAAMEAAKTDQALPEINEAISGFTRELLITSIAVKRAGEKMREAIKLRVCLEPGLEHLLNSCGDCLARLAITVEHLLLHR